MSNNQLARILEVVTTEALKRLECPVCLEQGQLKLLICGHNICQICEPRMVNRNNQLKCPQCQIFTTRPPGGLVNNYQLASVVTHLEDALSQLNQLSLDMCHQCQQCEERFPLDRAIVCVGCQSMTLCGFCAHITHRDHQTKLLATALEEERMLLARSIAALPESVLEGIVRYLHLNDVVRSRRVCRRFDQLISKSCNRLAKVADVHLAISFKRKGQLVQVAYRFPGHSEKSFSLHENEMNTFPNYLRHFELVELSLQMAQFSPDALSAVVDQLLQPSMSLQTISEISIRHCSRPMLIPHVQTLLDNVRLRFHQLRFDGLHSEVAPYINDGLVLRADLGQLTSLDIIGQDQQCQSSVTDAIFDVIDVRRFYRIQLHYCPYLTLDGGLRPFLQRWLNAGTLESSTRHLHLIGCAQLTLDGISQMCSQLLPAVRLVASTQTSLTIIASSQSRRSQQQQQRCMTIVCTPP